MYGKGSTLTYRLRDNTLRTITVFERVIDLRTGRSAFIGFLDEGEDEEPTDVWGYESDIVAATGGIPQAGRRVICLHCWENPCHCDQRYGTG